MLKKTIAFTLTVLTFLSVFSGTAAGLGAAAAGSSSAGDILPIYLAPVILTPATGSTLPYGTISITWDCKGAPAYYIIRLTDSTATTPLLFKTKDKYYKLAPESIKPDVKYTLDVGAVYGTIYTDDTNTTILPTTNIQWSAPVIFAMQPQPPAFAAPVILTPADGSSLPYGTVEITWECLGQPSYYIVRLMDPNLDNMGTTYITKDKYFKIAPENLKPDVNYQLDVGAAYEGVLMDPSGSILPNPLIKWSQQVTFSMQEQLPYRPAPVILTPLDGSTLPYGTVSITWECKGQPISYSVMLTDLATSYVYSFETKDTFLNLPADSIKPDTKYRIEVGAVYGYALPDGTIGPLPPVWLVVSEPVVFVMQPQPVIAAPVITSPASGSTLPYGTVAVTWDCAGQPLFYYVRLTNPLTADVLTYTTKDKFFKIAPESLKPNVKYTLTAGAAYDSMYMGPLPLTAWSDPVVFVMQPPLTAPVIQSPANGTTLTLGDVKVAWTESSGAAYYMLTAAKISATAAVQPMIQIKTTVPYCTIPAKQLSAGGYSIFVTAYASNGTAVRSTPITVFLKAPVVVTPGPSPFMKWLANLFKIFR